MCISEESPNHSAVAYRRHLVTTVINFGARCPTRRPTSAHQTLTDSRVNKALMRERRASFPIRGVLFGSDDGTAEFSE